MAILTRDRSCSPAAIGAPSLKVTRAMNSKAVLAPCTNTFDLSAFNVPHLEPFVCELKVSRDQLSSIIEHVSNIEYVRWLDRVAELHADSLGYTRQRLIEQNMMWFVARHEIDYLAEAWLDDTLLIATWVRDIQKVRSWREYVIARPSDSMVICRAATSWVLVDLNTRRPLRITPEMIERFKPLA